LPHEDFRRGRKAFTGAFRQKEREKTTKRKEDSHRIRPCRTGRQSARPQILKEAHVPEKKRGHFTSWNPDLPKFGRKGILSRTEEGDPGALSERNGHVKERKEGSRGFRARGLRAGGGATSRSPTTKRRPRRGTASEWERRGGSPPMLISESLLHMSNRRLAREGKKPSTPVRDGRPHLEDRLLANREGACSGGVLIDHRRVLGRRHSAST